MISMDPHTMEWMFQAILRGDDVAAEDLGRAIDCALRHGKTIPPGVLFYAAATIRKMDDEP